MMLSSSSLMILASLLALSSIPGILAIGGAMQGMEDAMEIQREQLERLRTFLGPESTQVQARAQIAPTITFSNPAADQFFVDGTTIPDGIFPLYHKGPTPNAHVHSLVNFDAGPSWAGLLPISADPNETRKLFFWCVP